MILGSGDVCRNKAELFLDELLDPGGIPNCDENLDRLDLADISDRVDIPDLVLNPDRVDRLERDTIFAAAVPNLLVEAYWLTALLYDNIAVEGFLGSAFGRPLAFLCCSNSECGT